MAPVQTSDALVRELAERQTARLGRYNEGVKRALEDLASQGFASRLWAKDPALWKKDEKDQRIIKERLGWLASVEAVADEIDPVVGFTDEVRRAGFTHAVLLGMGGSSLSAEVLRLTFGVSPGLQKIREVIQSIEL